MKREITNIEDQLLVMDAQDGNIKAMEMLVSRWQKKLWRHAFRLTSDTQAAWDVTQQTWLGIIKGLRKLHDPANFRPWAYKITTNKAINWIKKNRVSREKIVGEIPEITDKEKKDTGLKELLEKLEMRKKVVLCLYYFEQLSISEISVALKIPEGTVKSRLANARSELKELYQQHFE